MKPSLRSITSLAMAVLYLLIIGLPLAPLAMHSRQVVHAVTGECSGDCSICGCAPERSAARACCCWQKKRAQERLAGSSGKSCCNKPAGKEHLKVAERLRDSRHDGHDDHEAIDPAADNERPAPDGTVASISNCPCGSGKHLLLGGGDNVQHIPSIHAGGIPLLQNHSYPSLPNDRLISHHGEPPDPPPKLSPVA